MQMGKEGVRGLYKGNLTGILLGLFNTKLRMNLYEGLNKISNFSEQWKFNLISMPSLT
jgi:hypothetical protein